jgi:hypothetical protein
MAPDGLEFGSSKETALFVRLFCKFSRTDLIDDQALPGVAFMQRAIVSWVVLVTAAPLWAENQPLPEIDLAPPIECWYHSDFPMLTARLDPSADVVNSRLYFRCSLYQDYYFVDLESEGGTFTAVAPQAEETCPRVHYYVEAVTRDFTSARTPERVADVTTASECRRRFPTAAFFPGNDPQIVVGSTVAGPELAPGFKSIGVSAFVSATGVMAGAGSSGGSTALVAGAAAAAGAAVGLGVLVADGSSSDPPPPSGPAAPPPAVLPPVVEAPPPPPPPPPAQTVKACVRFDPVDAVVNVNEALTIDGRCSEGGSELTYRYDLGDGRIREGQAFITVVYADPGTYSLTLTVQRPDSSVLGARLEQDTIRRTVRVKAPFVTPVPAFDAYNIQIDSCRTEFNASATTGDVEEFLWELDVHNDFDEGVVRASGRIVQHEWGPGCFRAQGNTTVRLTVVGKDGSRNSLTKDVNVLRFIPLQTDTSALATSLSTHLVVDNSVRAQIVLGRGQSQPVTGGVVSMHSYTGVAGRNTVEGVLMAPLSAPALWRFDFSASAHFVPGSLRLVNGVELSRDARSIVVRMSGSAGERVRLDYELTP